MTITNTERRQRLQEAAALGSKHHQECRKLGPLEKVEYWHARMRGTPEHSRDSTNPERFASNMFRDILYNQLGPRLKRFWQRHRQHV